LGYTNRLPWKTLWILWGFRSSRIKS
jgi:hypothetical protein